MSLIAVALSRLHRPRVMTVLLLAMVILVAGCVGPSIRNQSPEMAALLELDADVKLVGDYATAWGVLPQRVESAALVTNLPNSGSDPPPSPQRTALMNDIQARGVVEPNRLLGSPTTSLVWVRGFIPPGVRRGERFDVFVEVPAGNDTESLSGGWLMETRLSEMAVLDRIRDGHVVAVAEGPLLVDPVASTSLDKNTKVRAIVPGGGVSLKSRSLGLVLQPEHRSVAVSKRLGDTINRRFHAVIRGSKRGVATPKTDRFIELEIPPEYEHHIDRYVKVVRCLAVSEPAGGRLNRLEMLSRQLTDPVTAPAAALRLEAIGEEAIPTLRKALEADDDEVRFHAAEALAYLGESTVAPHLTAAAAELRSARPAALAALEVLDDANGIEALESLLSSSSAETRYGAFRTLWKMDRTMPTVRGEQLANGFSLHVLDVGGPPLVHATRHVRPEIVLFGVEHPIDDGLRAEAGHNIVVSTEDGTARVSCFTPGKDDQHVECPARVEDVVRAIAEVGGTYPAAVQFLQQAYSLRALDSRLVFDAIPDAYDGRKSIHEEVSSQELPEETEADVDDGVPISATIPTGNDVRS
jgi:hypothetical protein